MTDPAQEQEMYRDEALPRGYFYLRQPPADRGTLPQAYHIDNADPFDFYHFRISNVCAMRRTAFQTVAIVDTLSFGRALFVDGAIQSSAHDEALYHELLVQPAMLMHDNPVDVLIIGGGEGARLREVLAHHTVKSATMVDIDREAVELCREHLLQWHRGAFADPRTSLHFEDGRAFLEKDDRLYDVIIIDVVDMLDNGPAQALYTAEFYQIVRQHLRPGGLLSVQALEFSHLDYKQHAALARTIRQSFRSVHSYRAAIPSFLSGWGFILAGDDIDPRDFTAQSIDARIERRLGREWLDHLTGDYLRATFSLCKETSTMLSLPGPVLRDDVKFVEPPDVEELEPFSATLPARKP